MSNGAAGHGRSSSPANRGLRSPSPGRPPQQPSSSGKQPGVPHIPTRLPRGGSKSSLSTEDAAAGQKAAPSPTHGSATGGQEKAGSDAEQAADGEDASSASALENPRKALLRKVAQLTKVVVHLTAKNDEYDAIANRVQQRFEDDISTISRDASAKMAALREQLGEHSDADALHRDALTRRKACSIGRDSERADLQAAKEKLRRQRHDVIEQERRRVAVKTQKLQQMTKQVRGSLEAFREVAKQSREEHERHDAAIREMNNEELAGHAAEHQKRLRELQDSQAREVQHLVQAREQALAHMRRMHESELSSLRMQAQQKRRDKIHRMEQSFGEKRRTIEQMTAHMQVELEQLKRDAADREFSQKSLLQQVESMRTALAEMTSRVQSAEADLAEATEEATAKEAEAAGMEKEIQLLLVRQRTAGVAGHSAAPAPPSARGVAAGSPQAQAGSQLSEDLRRAILGAKRLGVQREEARAELADLEDSMVESDKQLEVLEMEVEEERLRVHQLQTRLLESESLPRR
eukprot:TRINITY_DN23992_c0_g1_i1.p1 TRINITY_DN23992_c0_g1~~TRINITY_DN23992_c0_g1_i1.p1  ORF type:complete len:520 (+),score=194.68 TRINITY_DN23992_c0_g1_i1:110-1669(+)